MLLWMLCYGESVPLPSQLNRSKQMDKPLRKLSYLLALLSKSILLQVHFQALHVIVIYLILVLLLLQLFYHHHHDMLFFRWYIIGRKRTMQVVHKPRGS